MVLLLDPVAVVWSWEGIRVGAGPESLDHSGPEEVCW